MSSVFHQVNSGPIAGEVEVFRLCKFDPTKFYAFAYYTRRSGRYPNERYYTTNPLQYLGKHVNSERWGCGDGSGGAEYFYHGGHIERIEYDYEGTTCFVEVMSIEESKSSYEIDINDITPVLN